MQLLTGQQLLYLGVQVTCALRFLHQRSIRHSDVAARNCRCPRPPIGYNMLPALSAFTYSTSFTKHNGSTYIKKSNEHKQHGRIIAAQTSTLTKSARRISVRTCLSYHWTQRLKEIYQKTTEKPLQFLYYFVLNNFIKKSIQCEVNRAQIWLNERAGFKSIKQYRKTFTIKQLYRNVLCTTGFLSGFRDFSL